MTFLNLIKAELVMLYGEIKNYYLNYIFYNISILFTFIGLFYAFSNKGDKEALLLLFGLVTWQMSTSAINYLTYVIQDESLLGTLEQIFMTRTKVTEVFASKIIVNCLFNFIKAIILFIICMFVFGVGNTILGLGVKNILIMIIILITVFSFYGLGLMFGGISLYFKRVQSVCNTFTYLFLFFTGITIPIENLPKVIRPVSYVFPITWATRSIGEIVNSNTFNIFGSFNILVFIIVVITYFIIGYTFFKYSINKAKDQGKLGQY